MKIRRQVIGVLAVLLGLGSPLAAQEEPTTPCRATQCNLTLDWRGDVPNAVDRRYGNPFEFEGALLRHLRRAGYSFATGDSGDAGVMTIRVQPKMTKADCDVITGSNPETCQTIGEVRIEILNAPADLDIKGSFRVRARCGADQLMEVPRMSEYTAGMIGYELLKGQDRKKPSSRC